MKALARKSVVMMCFFAVLGWSAAASAQMVVSDPSNLMSNIEQAITAGKELQESAKILGENQKLNRKAQRIKNDTKKIVEGMTPGELAELRDYVEQVQGLYDQSRGLSYKYGDIVEEFEATYTEFTPTDHGGQDYQTLQRQWEAKTNHALKQAFKAHGYGGDNVKERMRRLDKLVAHSDNAEGVLEAIQLSNRIQAELVSQIGQLQQMMAADGRARLSHLAEQKANGRNERARSDRLMEGLGEGKERDVKDYPKFDK